ncbi:hypothetical protein [Gracilinema caldarium]|uniref:hypothetical protein n=1 Tax=Gracilinema caldarium TaxID=215591 RepID=UPI0026EB30F3|nr:hypothetical protein [Gracilinema caldarium]
MKRILAILAVVAAIFAVSSCDTAMHDGTSMYIEKIIVTNLPASMNNRTVELMGFWNGGSSATTDQQKIDNGTVTLTLTSGQLQSAPNPEFKIKPIDIDGGWNWAIGAKLRLGGDDVSNATIANTWTGPSTPKTIKGVVQSDGVTVTWTVE